MEKKIIKFIDGIGRKKFTFIDLFAGIGGIRMAFESAGGKCVFSSEIDKFARKTYSKNFGDVPHGDISKIDTYDIPDHDILCAGFPCQPFSPAGISSRSSLGKPSGFQDTRGTLFFEICRIIKAKKPKAVFLENIKNLRTHDGGKTFRVMVNALDSLGYAVYCTIQDSNHYVPQHRERIYIACFREDPQPGFFLFPESMELEKTVLGDILEENVPAKYTLKDGTWNCLQTHSKRHKERGNGFKYNLMGKNDVAKTLFARYYKDGSEILIKTDGNPRKLTPRECARLMGFPENFEIPVSDTQAYKQFGNSVVVPVVAPIAHNIATVL